MKIHDQCCSSPIAARRRAQYRLTNVVSFLKRKRSRAQRRVPPRDITRCRRRGRYLLRSSRKMATPTDRMLYTARRQAACKRLLSSAQEKSLICENPILGGRRHCVAKFHTSQVVHRTRQQCEALSWRRVREAKLRRSRQ